ncbi:MAG: DUF1295 domain-containing protein [Acidobacteriota bacterium]
MIALVSPTIWLPEAVATAGIVLAFCLIALWLVSLVRRDVSIIDLFWGFGFVLCAWIYRALGGEVDLRQAVQLALVTVWGLRLSGYLTWRNWGKDEDRRYAEMRRQVGESFRWRSLITVFFLQGFLILVISAPLYWVQTQDARGGDSAPWNAVDFLAVACWSIGFFFEAVGDWQLARFKADPSNEGKVLRSGVWATTRHPNYFGEMMMWIGYFLFAASLPGGWWTLFSPILMTTFLLKVSGVSLLEKDIAERRPKYRDYVRSTNAFFPWPPKKN